MTLAGRSDVSHSLTPRRSLRASRRW